jgi:hypothetical protein
MEKIACLNILGEVSPTSAGDQSFPLAIVSPLALLLGVTVTILVASQLYHGTTPLVG